MIISTTLNCHIDEHYFKSPRSTYWSARVKAFHSIIVLTGGDWFNDEIEECKVEFSVSTLATPRRNERGKNDSRGDGRRPRSFHPRFLSAALSRIFFLRRLRMEIALRTIAARTVNYPRRLGVKSRRRASCPSLLIVTLSAKENSIQCFIEKKQKQVTLSYGKWSPSFRNMYGVSWF